MRHRVSLLCIVNTLLIERVLLFAGLLNQSMCRKDERPLRPWRLRMAGETTRGPRRRSQRRGPWRTSTSFSQQRAFRCGHEGAQEARSRDRAK